MKRRLQSRDDRPARERPATLTPHKTHRHDDPYDAAALGTDVFPRVTTDLHESNQRPSRRTRPTCTTIHTTLQPWAQTSSLA